MRNFHKAAMIVGLVAMMGLGLLLCFVPSKYSMNHPHYMIERQR